MNKPELRGLYCITEPALSQQSPHGLETMVQQAIEGGARIIQYRDKHADRDQQTEMADRLCRLCQKQGVVFLINDDPQLARAVNADGVHLGQSDTGLREAREMLGEHKIIGITCHASLELALQAQQQGADYVAFGRFFPSHTKPQASPAPLALLPEARAALQIPIAAIGGIDLTNAPPLLAAGVDMLAVIHAVFAQADIRHAAADFAQLFTTPQGS